MGSPFYTSGDPATGVPPCPTHPSTPLPARQRPSPTDGQSHRQPPAQGGLFPRTPLAASTPGQAGPDASSTGPGSPPPMPMYRRAIRDLGPLFSGPDLAAAELLSLDGAAPPLDASAPDSPSLKSLRPLHRISSIRVSGVSGASGLSRRPLSHGQDASRYPSWLRPNQPSPLQMQTLYAACSSGDVHVVRSILSQFPRSVVRKMRDHWGRGPLHIAAAAGQLDVVTCLLEMGVRINVGDCNGTFPIQLAATSAHLDVVALLVREGAQLHPYDLSLMLRAALRAARQRLRASRRFVDQQTAQAGGEAHVDPATAHRASTRERDTLSIISVISAVLDRLRPVSADGQLLALSSSGRTGGPGSSPLGGGGLFSGPGPGPGAGDSNDCRALTPGTDAPTPASYCLDELRSAMALVEATLLAPGGGAGSGGTGGGSGGSGGSGGNSGSSSGGMGGGCAGGPGGPGDLAGRSLSSPLALHHHHVLASGSGSLSDMGLVTAGCPFSGGGLLLAGPVGRAGAGAGAGASAGALARPQALLGAPGTDTDAEEAALDRLEAALAGIALVSSRHPGPGAVGGASPQSERSYHQQHHQHFHTSVNHAPGSSSSSLSSSTSSSSSSLSSSPSAQTAVAGAGGGSPFGSFSQLLLQAQSPHQAFDLSPGGGASPVSVKGLLTPGPAEVVPAPAHHEG
ncbi:hypothetical protein H696_04276 [Fonticula alba]|uniref:Uncharacterized protein n=1 Tax=Fonticula alba TaxID=691883 RepID=A0A058Z4K6_FONAL|nr:hypothetical protein H696_04276 [Fonticula alba]KCV68858.1 hypothetical protein H696_04276 [Fonticula alba]|eukprot:XP_009496429.1 hypothetical protein H696_04276 [Fonticula alba]